MWRPSWQSDEINQVQCLYLVLLLIKNRRFHTVGCEHATFLRYKLNRCELNGCQWRHIIRAIFYMSTGVIVVGLIIGGA